MEDYLSTNHSVVMFTYNSPAILETGLIGIHPRDERINAAYLLEYLKSKTGRIMLQTYASFYAGHASHTTYISPNRLKGLPVPLVEEK